MLSKFATAAVLSVFVAGAAFAAGDVALTDENTAQVRTVLTEQGYEVAKVRLEDGMYEAYARKDGERYEIYLNGDFEVVRVKKDS